VNLLRLKPKISKQNQLISAVKNINNPIGIFISFSLARRRLKVLKSHYLMPC